MAITVAEARTALLNLKRDLSDVSDATFIEWCNHINRYAYHQMSGIDPERFISSSTINVVSGTSSYSLPADFESIQAFGTGLYYVDDNGDDTEKRRPLTSFGSQTYGYYVTGSAVVLTPEPEDTETYKLRYIPKITALTATTDSLVIPDEYLLLVVDALDALYSKWDEDSGAEVLADQRYTRALNDLALNIKRGPMIASLPVVSNY